MLVDRVARRVEQLISQLPYAENLQQFISQSGPVIWGLIFVVTLCALLICERCIYLVATYPRQKRDWVSRWDARTDHDSWYATSIREGYLFEARQSLFQSISFIKALVMICPMLGLLGTVTGMISVFDVLSQSGSSAATDSQLMADGISRATLPTMAGMVAALSGLFVHSWLQRACHSRQLSLEAALRAHR